MLNNNNEWIPAKNPIHYDKPEKCGVGPALTFATTIATFDDLIPKENKIGLIPCAVGGSSLLQWLPIQDRNISPTPSGELETKHICHHHKDMESIPEHKDIQYIPKNGTIHICNENKHEEKDEDDEEEEEHDIKSKSSLIYNDKYKYIEDNEYKNEENYFDQAIQRVQYILNTNNNCILNGILWHQGESDSLQIQTAHGYLNNVIKVFNGFRYYFNDENLPILVGGLPSFLGHEKSIHFNSITQQHENFTYFTIINQALMLLPERLPNIAYVSVDKLTHKGDYLHFDTKSAEELGTRYAMTYANMCGYNEMNTIVKRTSKKAIEKN